MTVEAFAVPEQIKMEVLPRHFGRYMLVVERRIYNVMSQVASAYSGGYWRFFELGNGGFYMSPPGEAYDIFIDGNGFDSRMSADAAGITVCLFAFSQLSFEHPAEVFARHFHRLRDFACGHVEAARIFQAID
jgi:hypothetical protein